MSRRKQRGQKRSDPLRAEPTREDQWGRTRLMFHCVQWQLAEKHADVGANPLVPLLRCYRAGAYPFSLDRDTVVLFRFTG